MKALKDAAYDPTRPLQTKRGAQQALQVGKHKLQKMIREGRLKTVYFGRDCRITTQSILDYAAKGDGVPTTSVELQRKYVRRRRSQNRAEGL